MVKKTRFNPRTVDVRGLTKKQASRKMQFAYKRFHLYDDLENVYMKEVRASGKVYSKINGKICQRGT